MRLNLSAKFEAQGGEWVLPQSPSGEIWGVNLNSGRAMNAMKFIKIYAASVRDTMQQAGRDLAGREALTTSLSRKI